MRRFRPPWTVEQIPGGYKVLDASGQSLASMGARQRLMLTSQMSSPWTRLDALPLAVASHTAIDCEPFLDEVEQSFAL
jgi:hypothetical protein